MSNGSWCGSTTTTRRPLDADRILRVDRGPAGLRLATARNTGAAAAIASGAALIVFLDADCVPGPDLLDRYRAAALAHPDAVLAGPVTYLPPGFDVSDRRLCSARPRRMRRDRTRRIAPRRSAAADEYPLFWSLSFAVSAATWVRIGGFHEAYEGYGGEDTDFAFTLRSQGFRSSGSAAHTRTTSTTPLRRLRGSISTTSSATALDSRSGGANGR